MRAFHAEPNAHHARRDRSAPAARAEAALCRQASALRCEGDVRADAGSRLSRGSSMARSPANRCGLRERHAEPLRVFVTNKSQWMVAGLEIVKNCREQTIKSSALAPCAGCAHRGVIGRWSVGHDQPFGRIRGLNASRHLLWAATARERPRCRQPSLAQARPDLQRPRRGGWRPGERDRWSGRVGFIPLFGRRQHSCAAWRDVAEVGRKINGAAGAPLFPQRLGGMPRPIRTRLFHRFIKRS
jgi:hypothetical protein